MIKTGIRMSREEFLELEENYGFEEAVSILAAETAAGEDLIESELLAEMVIDRVTEGSYRWGAAILDALAEDDLGIYWWRYDEASQYSPEPVVDINDIEDLLD